MGAVVSERHTTDGMKKSGLDLHGRRGSSDPFRNHSSRKGCPSWLAYVPSILRLDVCELCCFDIVQSRCNRLARPL
jgi:hypothetical protein